VRIKLDIHVCIAYDNSCSEQVGSEMHVAMSWCFDCHK